MTLFVGGGTGGSKGGDTYAVGTNGGSFGAGGNGFIIFTYTIPVPVPVAAGVTPPPIQNNVVLPGVAGIESNIKVLDMTSGTGPSMTKCLLGTVKQILGAMPLM